ncbi:MAG: DUF6311 domain-containing protein [Bacteroidota bacterium]
MKKGQNGFVVFLLAVLALILLHLKFGWQILDPTHTNWMLVQCSDGVVGYNGWEHFKDEAWTFPLGELTTYQYPLTTNIGLTDSIPLMSILFKLLHPLFGETDYHFYGIWIALSFLLQAYFAYRLLKALGVQQLTLQVIGSAFFLLAPVFLHRFVHPSLSMHWAILASFWLYFDTALSVRKRLGLQFLFTALMAWTHPYAAAILLGCTATLIAKLCWIEKVLNWKKGLGLFLTAIAMLSSLWYVVGYFNSGAELNNNDFGFYSANFNTLFNAMGRSQFLETLPLAKKGQYEGFGYLGLGVLLMLALALFLNRKYWKRVKIIALLPILIFSFLATFYAFSDEWTFNEYTFLKLPYPSFLTQQFRSSGRFIWIMHYLFIAFSIAGIAKMKWTTLGKTAILLALFGLQAFDIQSLWSRKYVRHDGKNFQYKEKLWSPALEAAEQVITYPPYAWEFVSDCDQAKLTHLAAQFDKAITCGRTVYGSSKQKNEFRDYLNLQIDSLQIEGEQNSLFITSSQYAPKFRKLVKTDAVKAFLVEDYLIFIPTKLYQKANLQATYPEPINKHLITQNLVEFLESRKEESILLSVKDDAKEGLDDYVKEYLARRGSNIHRLAFRGSYAAILEQDSIVTEQIIENDTALIVNEQDQILIASAGRKAGNFSRIEVNGQSYSPNTRGINIVVLKNGKVQEIATYDTYQSIFHRTNYSRKRSDS